MSLNLKAHAKSTHVPVTVSTVDHHDSPLVLQWIKETTALKQTIQYEPRLEPLIETLMQTWPLEIEEQWTSVNTSELDLSLKSYVRLLTVLLDIPHTSSHPKSHIDAAFNFCQLYLAFKQSDHFKSMD